MKQIKAMEILFETLDKDLSWRKKEIINIKNLKSTIQQDYKNHLLRSGILLFYSHWEGFIKSSSESFLNYISFKGHSHAQLKTNYHAMTLTTKFKTDFKFEELVFFLDNIHSTNFSINEAKIINTKANLSYEVFSEIVNQLNLDISPYEAEQTIINLQLLAVRNKIAHGNTDYDIEEIDNSFISLAELVIKLLDTFNSQIRSLVSSKSFLRA